MTDWLPEMIPVSPWNHETYDILYNIFCRDIRDHDLRYCDKEVWTFPEKEDGKEIIFWHLTSRKAQPTTIPRRMRRFYPQDQTDFNTERLPDFRRCERLPWVKALIENPSKPDVLAWDYEEGNALIKTYIWIKNHNFVVILKKYNNRTRRIITSFYVDKEYTKMDFERKYACRIK